VKSQYPIPLIDDLLDKCVVPPLSSKWTSGYHQIRMEEKDVYKTAFKTHQDHFEYKFMPFGLTNATATFNNLMNMVFKPLLRRFVLVFFDDILVNSEGLESHGDHLRLMLPLLLYLS